MKNIFIILIFINCVLTLPFILLSKLLKASDNILFRILLSPTIIILKKIIPKEYNSAKTKIKRLKKQKKELYKKIVNNLIKSIKEKL